MSSYVDRFRGIEQLYGKGSLTKLQKSRITVVGLGGVGSWVVEGLVRCGIGNLQLIDIDEICLHNTNRQAYANISTIGQSKAQVLKEQALQINPDCLIDIEQTFFKAKNAQVILDNSGSIIIDAIDAYQEKSLLIAESKKRQLEVITIGSTGGKKLNSDIQVVKQRLLEYQEKIKEDTALINALTGALQQCDYFLEQIDNVEPDLVSDSGDEG